MRSSNTVLDPILETPSLQDRAYEAIKSSILTLVLPPGTQLSESDLASQLKVSKTPVREALQRLERENLVNIIPRKGAFVTEISVTEIQEISEIRSILVGLAARRAAALVSDQDLDNARQILEAGDQALKNGDEEEWLRLNDQFHTWLLEKASNKSLLKMISILDEYFQRIQRLAASVPGEMIESNLEHYEILEAIASRDPLKADRVASGHIFNVGEQAIRRLNT